MIAFHSEFLYYPQFAPLRMFGPFFESLSVGMFMYVGRHTTRVCAGDVVIPCFLTCICMLPQFSLTPLCSVVNS